jgi:hypothetical protein
MGIFNKEADYEIASFNNGTPATGAVDFFRVRQDWTKTIIRSRWTIVRDRKFHSTFTYEYLTGWEFFLDDKRFSIETAGESDAEMVLRVGSREFLYLGDHYFPMSMQERFFPRRACWKTDIDDLPRDIESSDETKFTWDGDGLFGSELFAEYMIRYRLRFDLPSFIVRCEKTRSSGAICHTD